MAVISITCSARCKDCNKMKRAYKGKLTRHWCLYHERFASPRDKVCKEYSNDFFNPVGMPVGKPLFFD